MQVYHTPQTKTNRSKQQQQPHAMNILCAEKWKDTTATSTTKNCTVVAYSILNDVSLSCVFLLAHETAWACLSLLAWLNLSRRYVRILLFNCWMPLPAARFFSSSFILFFIISSCIRLAVDRVTKKYVRFSTTTLVNWTEMKIFSQSKPFARKQRQ